MSNSWFAIIPVKDGEETIRDAIYSLINQSIKPSYIIVVDDGSIDNTPNILKDINSKYNKVHVITLPDKGYDIRRIVHNWNRALEYADSLPYVDYQFISADDCIFPNNYVEYLINKMKENSRLVIVSGSRELNIKTKIKVPEGAGRLIDNKFFRSIGNRYPPYYGYESWILFKALQLGFEIKIFPEITYKHARKFGSKHNFIEYGASMRCLGYTTLFVIGRSMRNILFGRDIPIKASLKMIYDYIFADIKFRHDPYYKPYDEEFRRFVKNLQYKRLKELLGAR
jgi:glycosyltransferase involved in cell wall biosynthesis